MPREFKSFLKTVAGNEGGKCKYNTRLDLYGCGCVHDCAYCYAKSLLDFRHLWNPHDPAVADIRKVARRLKRIPSGTILRLGGMTDCFQPTERVYHATREAIRIMNDRGIGYLIVTKSALVAADEYLALLDPRLAHIQVSISTTSDALAQTYERASLPSARIAVIEKLAAQGFDVAVRLSPFIPQYNDFAILNAIRCRKILVEFLRVNTWIARWFELDYSEYSLKHSGYLHLPLERKIEYLKPITGFEQKTVCEDVTEHYNYWRYCYNPNPDDCCNLTKI